MSYVPRPLSPPPPPRMLRTADAAAYLGISVWTLRKLVREGKIKCQFGNGVRSPWLFDLNELNRYIEEQQWPRHHR